MAKKNVIIIGAAGRDFHNFNTCYRDNSSCNVVAFTATQIPNIDGRMYPTELAGNLYPDGIKIYDESELTNLNIQKSLQAGFIPMEFRSYPKRIFPV